MTNNRFKTARQQLGWSLRYLSILADVGYSTCRKYETLSLSPITVNGKWRESARRLAHALGLPPEDLWPESQPSTTTIEEEFPTLLASQPSTIEEEPPTLLTSQLEGSCYASSPNPQDTALFEKQAVSEVLQAGHVLGERNQKILYRRIALNHTLQDIATDFGLCVERVSQICETSIRKIQCELKRTKTGKELLLLGQDVLNSQ